MFNNIIIIVMKRLLLLALFVALMTFFCGHDRFWDRDDNDTDTNICGQEPCYEGPFDPPWISAYDNDVWFIDGYGRKLPCDNRVLETENVLTFSDASSDEVKIEYAGMAEASLAEIQALFVIDSQDLGIVDLHSKITIFSNRYEDYDQHATRKGFLLIALDNPFWDTWAGGLEGPEFLAYYQRVVKHEMMHVVQFMMGAVNVDTWFREGLAEHVAGGTFEAITTWEQVEEWRQDPDHINPISIHQNSDYPTTASSSWYAMFRVAVAYLLDERGRNRSIMDVKHLFLDVADNIPFADAFETRMGLGLQDYEDHFFEWIRAYFGG